MSPKFKLKRTRGRPAGSLPQLPGVVLAANPGGAAPTTIPGGSTSAGPFTGDFIEGTYQFIDHEILFMAGSDAARTVGGGFALRNNGTVYSVYNWSGGTRNETSGNNQFLNAFALGTGDKARVQREGDNVVLYGVKAADPTVYIKLASRSFASFGTSAANIGGKVEMQGMYGSVQNLTYGMPALPLSIGPAGVEQIGNNKVRVTLNYVNSVAPTKFQISFGAGSYADMVIVSTTGPGNATCEGIITASPGIDTTVNFKDERGNVASASISLDPVLRAPTLGSNINVTSNPWRGQRTYTNGFYQSYMQLPNDNNREAYFRSDPAIFTTKNLPKPGAPPIQYMLPVPDTDGDHVMEFSWVGGDFTWQAALVEGTFVSITGSPTQTGPTTWTIPINVNRQFGTDGQNTFMSIRINSCTASPTSMFWCKVGDDKTKRYLPAYIDFLKQLTGPMRDMDDMAVNGPASIAAYPGWANRSRRDVYGPQAHGRPFEDAVELSILANRPLWHCTSSAHLYDAAGTDYLERMFDLMFNGVGSDTGQMLPHPSGLVCKHKIENDNEQWNPTAGPFNFLLNKSLTLGHYVDDPGTDDRAYAVSVERVRNVPLLGAIMQAKVPNWRDLTEYTFGFQQGQDDSVCAGLFSVQDAAGQQARWATALTWLTRCCRQGYLPADSNTSDIPTQPTALTNVAIVQWLRDYLVPQRTLLQSDASRYIKSWGLPMDLYEYNYSMPGIIGRTRQIERSLKSSQELYDFTLNEWLPSIMPFAGDACAYYDMGAPQAGQSWYFYEGPDAYQGNKQWDAMIAWGKANGVLPV